jgi:hypothetical protein
MDTPTGETRDDTPDPGEDPKNGLIIASFQIRAIIRGDREMVEAPLVTEIVAAVKTALAELVPGTFSNVSAERLDT